MLKLDGNIAKEPLAPPTPAGESAGARYALPREEGWPSAGS